MNGVMDEAADEDDEDEAAEDDEGAPEDDDDEAADDELDDEGRALEDEGRALLLAGAVEDDEDAEPALLELDTPVLLELGDPPPSGGTVLEVLELEPDLMTM